VNHQRTILKLRERRRWRVRKRFQGVAERPRLSVFRSHKHIYAQAIDDSTGRTLAAASTREKELGVTYGGNKAAAQAVGKAIAERLQAAGIKHVAFDRGAFQYHGRVAALAEAAREGGLQF
jgi:large subunit ribosomal protein L18